MHMKRSFKSLDERELLGLAMSLEAEEGQLYREYARRMRPSNPLLATTLQGLSEEETEHEQELEKLYRGRFGEEIPLIRRTDVLGFIERPPLPEEGKLGPEEIAKQVEWGELETGRFYERAAQFSKDPTLRDYFANMAKIEAQHSWESATKILGMAAEDRGHDRAKRNLILLQIIQPGLVGLMDGSVSTLAPLFATAYATRSTWATFLVGLAASIGAAISMGFAEGLSDDGSLTGRGKPFARGVVTGLMTFVGGIFHALPYLIQDFVTATTVAVVVVVVELLAIAYVRNRYMDTPFLRAMFQVVVGGLLVFAAGVLIGNA
ncbi:MAG: ferritin family protein [bacterium]